MDNGTVYAAGYEQQGDAIVGKIWVNGTLKYQSHRLRAPILFDFGRGRQSQRRRQRGRERRPDGQNLEGRRGVTPIGEPCRVAGQSRGSPGATFTPPQAAFEADSGSSSPWSGRTTRRISRSDGQADAGATALCLDGRSQAGYAGLQAVVWKDGSVLYADRQQLSAQATAVCRSGARYTPRATSSTASRTRGCR